MTATNLSEWLVIEWEAAGEPRSIMARPFDIGHFLSGWVVGGPGTFTVRQATEADRGLRAIGVVR